MEITAEHCRAGRVVVGNMTLESFEAVAPNRRCACAAVMTTIYADQLTITPHYDPRPLAREQADDILTAFVRRLRAADRRQ
jgi:hypothetical protein